LSLAGFLSSPLPFDPLPFFFKDKGKVKGLEEGTGRGDLKKGLEEETG